MNDMKTQLANVGAAALAGLSISIGGMALLKQGNGFGTVLFSIGLIAVFILGGRLCTVDCEEVKGVIKESDKTAIPFKKDGTAVTFETTANEVYKLI